MIQDDTQDGPVLELTVEWLDAVAAELRDVVAELTRLAVEVVADWQDERGREWAERADGVARDLARQADAGTELARCAGRASQDTGPRLGATDGTRVAEGYGARIATLSDPPR